MIAGTPAGVSLSPEGGAHQSIKTPLIGMSQPGLASFEPAYADELAAIMAWGLDYMQRDAGDGSTAGTAMSADSHGGSVYLRLSTRTIDQPAREMTEDLKQAIIAGGYWIEPPTADTRAMIAYAGTVAPEARAAARDLGAQGIGVAVLAVTSAGRLHAGWTAAQRQRRNDQASGPAQIETLLEPLHRDCAIVSVIDGHPAALAWLGSVHGHRLAAHGVEAFGETGTIADLYRLHGLDAEAITAEVKTMIGGNIAQHRQMKAS